MTNRSDYQKAYREGYRTRAKRVNLTFGLSEYAALERAAKASGLPIAAYVKACALRDHEGRTDPPEAVLEELADLSRVVRTIANNVNQMARHSNTIGRVLDEHEVLASIQHLQRRYEEAIRRSSAPGDGADDPFEDGRR